jgi:hypothetical protein
MAASIISMRTMRDAKRDNHFASRGFRILRFWNNEVDQNLEGVLTFIDNTLRNPHPTSPGARPGSATLPFGEGSSPIGVPRR